MPSKKPIIKAGTKPRDYSGLHRELHDALLTRQIRLSSLTPSKNSGGSTTSGTSKLVKEFREHAFPTRDMQVGGDHYKNKKVQPWDSMKAWFTHEEFCGYLRGNVIKYVARYKDKGGLEDLKKAAHYLQKLIEEESNVDAT